MTIRWLLSGLARTFGGFEKGSFYLHNHFFWPKMGLLAAILILMVLAATGMARGYGVPVSR